MAKYWWQNIGGKILVAKYWWQNIGGKILVAKYWWQNIGGKILVAKYWWQNIGGKILVRSDGPSDLASQAALGSVSGQILILLVTGTHPPTLNRTFANIF